MSDEKPIYLKMETGYAFTQDMNNEVVEKFYYQPFNQSAILKIKYYNPKSLIIQHFPEKKK